MTRILFIFLMILCLCRGYSQETLPYRNATLPVETRVADLLGRMTPEEKFWQLFMIPGDLSDGKERYQHGIFGLQLSEAGAHDAAGQIVTHRNPLAGEEMARHINGIQRYFVEETRLGIPVIFFEEALHGLLAEGATVFPQSIALAATFDTSLMGRVARAIAAETALRGVRQVLSPVVNVATDVRWGRVEETYGEDPFLASRMGVAFVSAFEKSGIITTPKHFLANAGDGGRDSYPAEWNRRTLEEIHLPPFRACFGEGGSRSVMTSYNSLDGSPCTANRWLLDTLLRGGMGFTGFTISDACAVGGANVLHYTATGYEDAGVRAISSGLDVILQTSWDHHTLFIPPFLDGTLDKAVIDTAVARVLRVKFQLGLFDRPYLSVRSGREIEAAHRDLCREAASRSFVLLRNDKGILPLSDTVRTMALIGTDAATARFGGYSGRGNDTVTILEGLQQQLGNRCRIRYEPGCGRISEDWVTVPAAALSHHDGAKTLPGLKGEYFNNATLSGTPDLVRTDRELNFRWTLYSPDPAIQYDLFSVRWSGQLTAPLSGSFRIGMEGNTGYRLWLDGKLLVEHLRGGSHGARLATVTLEKGKSYDLRVDFAETSGSVWLRLVWDAGLLNDGLNAIARSVELAKQCDVAIVVAGLEEGEGRDRARLSLPGLQEELIRQVAETGKPLVVLLVGGSAITMTSWMESAGAILNLWYPGEQGGAAVADVLTGRVNPAGRLPVTFPMEEGQLPLVYNHKPTGRNDDYSDLTGKPLFPFGYGLSYTTFEYSDLRIVNPVIAPGDTLHLTFRLRNTGNRQGDEVVQLYLRDLLSTVVRPLKELKGFVRIGLSPGEAREVTLSIPPSAMEMLNERMERVIEPGDFRLMIGASSGDIRLRGVFSVKSSQSR